MPDECLSGPCRRKASKANEDVRNALCQRKKESVIFSALHTSSDRGGGGGSPPTTPLFVLMLCKQRGPPSSPLKTPHINMHRKCLKVNYRQHSEWRLFGEEVKVGRKGRVPWALILIYGRQTFLHPQTLRHLCVSW